MNIFLWILQILLALHTAAGAIWKFSNSEQIVPSLNAIPHGAWMAMSVIELFISLAFVLPAFSRRLGIFAPIAAICILVEMIIFCIVNLFSNSPDSTQMIYWLVVATICAFIAYGRFVLKPHS